MSTGSEDCWVDGVAGFAESSDPGCRALQGGRSKSWLGHRGWHTDTGKLDRHGIYGGKGLHVLL